MRQRTTATATACAHATAQKLFIFFVRRLSIASLLLCRFQECQKKSNEALILISLLRLLLLLLSVSYSYINSFVAIRSSIPGSSFVIFSMQAVTSGCCEDDVVVAAAAVVDILSQNEYRVFFSFKFFFFLSHSEWYTIEGIALKRKCLVFTSNLLASTCAVPRLSISISCWLESFCIIFVFLSPLANRIYVFTSMGKI